MLIDPCELSPVVRPLDRALPAGQADLRAGARDGPRRSDIVKLASNENPLGIGPRTRAAIEAALADIARYPGRQRLRAEAGARRALRRRHGLDRARQRLERRARAGRARLPRAGARGGVFAARFAVYPLATQARGARSIVVPAKNYGHDLEAMARAIDDETYVVWIANPNNPTGTFARRDEIEAFLRRCPSACWWCSTRPTTNTCRTTCAPTRAQWLKRHPNLVVTRTFSKAYGLAGLRVGYALAHPSVADVMNRVRQPFNVNSIALAAAAAALDDMEFVARSYAREPAGHAPDRGGLRAPRARLHSLVRQLPHACAWARRRRSTSGCCAAASSCGRSAATACPSTCASPSAPQPRTRSSSPRSRASLRVEADAASSASPSSASA